MDNKNIHDRRQVKLENMLKSDYLPLGSGRPERETVIDDDDLNNLSIAFNTTKNMEEFIEKI